MRPMPAPTAVVADDERLMRDHVVARLKEAWPELQIVGEASNGREAIDLVRSLGPDIAFLDISMPGTDGIEAARALAGQVHVVFVTAHDEYAIRAFIAGYPRRDEVVCLPPGPSISAEVMIPLVPDLQGIRLAFPLTTSPEIRGDKIIKRRAFSIPFGTGIRGFPLEFCRNLHPSSLWQLSLR